MDGRPRLPSTRMPSRPGEFHPEPLTEPDLILSHHSGSCHSRRLPPSIERCDTTDRLGAPAMNPRREGHARPANGTLGLRLRLTCNPQAPGPAGRGRAPGATAHRPGRQNRCAGRTQSVPTCLARGVGGSLRGAGARRVAHLQHAARLAAPWGQPPPGEAEHASGAPAARS